MSESPRTPQQWSEFYAQQAKRREAQSAHAERSASKARKGKDVPHPLLTAPGAADHHRQAEARVEQARRAEHARRSATHPQVRLAHVPVPQPPAQPHA